MPSVPGLEGQEGHSSNGLMLPCPRRLVGWQWFSALRNAMPCSAASMDVETSNCHDFHAPEPPSLDKLMAAPTPLPLLTQRLILAQPGR